MPEVIVKKSKRFKELTDEQFVNRFLLSLGKEFLKEWDKESQSKDYWRKSGLADTGRIRAIKNEGSIVGYKAIMKSVRNSEIPPLPDKLTVRTGNLIDQLVEGAAGAIRNVMLRSNGVVSVFKGVRASVAPYANRQERQKSGARSYIGRALTKLFGNMDVIKKRALRKVLV